MQKEEKLAIHLDWGAGRGAAGAGALERKEEKRRKEEKKAWAMGNPQVMRIWEVNGDPQQ